MIEDRYVVINDEKDLIDIQAAFYGLNHTAKKGGVSKLTKSIVLCLEEDFYFTKIENTTSCDPKLSLTIEGCKQLRYLLECEKIPLNAELRNDLVLKLEYLLLESTKKPEKDQSYREKVALMEKMYASRKVPDVPRFY